MKAIAIPGVVVVAGIILAAESLAAEPANKPASQPTLQITENISSVKNDLRDLNNVLTAFKNAVAESAERAGAPQNTSATTKKERAQRFSTDRAKLIAATEKAHGRIAELGKEIEKSPTLLSADGLQQEIDLYKIRKYYVGLIRTLKETNEALAAGFKLEPSDADKTIVKFWNDELFVEGAVDSTFYDYILSYFSRSVLPKGGSKKFLQSIPKEMGPILNRLPLYVRSRTTALANDITEFEQKTDITEADKKKIAILETRLRLYNKLMVAWSFANNDPSLISADRVHEIEELVNAIDLGTGVSVTTKPHTQPDPKIEDLLKKETQKITNQLESQNQPPSHENTPDCN